MNGVLEIVLIAAAILYMLVRRFLGEPVQAKRMLLLPAVLMVVGLVNLSHVASTTQTVLLLAVTTAVSVAIGALRGCSVRITQRDGVAFVRYTWVTLLLWVANVAVKLGANVVFGDHAVGNSMMLSLGAGILAEGVVVLYRALRADHQVTWARGRDGAPHQTSPMLDNLQRSLGNRDRDAHAAEWNTRTDRVHRR